MGEKIVCRVLTGPTGSGKTRLATKLAEEMHWDIICMDSMQIYRRMDIGTAKPTPQEQEKVRHHLIDICEPAESFSVSMYRDEAEATIQNLHEQNRGFLIVGGTGLYLQSLMYPMAMGGVPADESPREKLKQRLAADHGREELHQMLHQLDPRTADRLPVNDTRRVIRAIEVSLMTGIPYSEQPDRKEKAGNFTWKIASTRPERDLLYQKINQRVDQMIRDGLKEEVERLLDEHVPENAQSMSGLGYKEMIPHIHGACSLEESAEAIKLGTRHYAKRQMTFLRREEEIRYFDPEKTDAYDQLRRILL